MSVERGAALVERNLLGATWIVLVGLLACGDDADGGADASAFDSSEDVAGGGCVEDMVETRPTAACGEESRTCSMGAWSDWSRSAPDQPDPECRIGEALFANRDGCDAMKVRYRRCADDCRWEAELTECGGGCDGTRRTEPWDEEEICVPAGAFTRGCDDESQDCFPRHEVYLSAFYIDRHTVTVGRYQRCVDAGACSPLEPHFVRSQDYTYDDLAFDEPDMGVWTATHEQAEAFCAWDNAELVTGAQWERAATGIYERVDWPFTDRLGLQYLGPVPENDWCDDFQTFSDDEPLQVGNFTPDCGTRPPLPPRFPDLNSQNDVAQSSIGVSNYYRFFEWTSDTLAPYAPTTPPERDPRIAAGSDFERRGSPMGAWSASFRRHVAARDEAAEYHDFPRASIRCARPAQGAR